MASYADVPTEDEIKELLRGKTKKEKRKLLKEIAKAREQKVHMEYVLEQQKIRAAEKWARRNVEERQALEALNNNTNPEAARDAILKHTNAVLEKGTKIHPNLNTKEEEPSIENSVREAH